MNAEGRSAVPGENPVELLQRLIRFDTTNPPGNERACIEYIHHLLNSAGIEARLVGRDPHRPNLVARLQGEGKAPPLLLYGHVDVVPTTNQPWSRDPFGGELVDGYVWGRGALDMKGGVAMLTAAFLRAAVQGDPLPGDVILAVLSDEEAGGDYGARFLVEEHAHLFAGVRYALGEFGGFSWHVGGRRFYPIQVAEKSICWLRLTTRGPGGHGAFGVRGGALGRLGRVLQTLDERGLPIHVIPPVRRMLEAMGRELEAPLGPALIAMTDPARTEGVLADMGPEGAFFNAMLRNTASATILQGGEKINVIPSQASVEVDGRLLPGFGPEQMVGELRDLLGADLEVEVVRHEPGPSETDMGLFDTLAGVLKESDPGGLPIPMVLPAVTDGRHFARIGIQTYGFTPMSLPPDMPFLGMIHAADERIPAAAVEFGTEQVHRVLTRFGG